MNEEKIAQEVLTVGDIAGYLRVSEATVWRWCNSGKLPAFRIGRSWRMRRSDLERYIEQVVAEPDATLKPFSAAHPSEPGSIS
jgi:excisionase family DNA binding protein